MSRCSHEMTVTSYCFYFCLVLLLLISHISYEVNGTTFNRYRSRPYNVKKAVEESTETSSAVTDQTVVDNSRHHKFPNEDYGYGSLDLNLVRPNKEPHLHAQISTKYTTSIISDHTPASSLEDAETAEEYVSKAIQRYGSRLKEPIRIEPEPNIVSEASNIERATNFLQKTSSKAQPSELQQDFISQQTPQLHQEEDRSELDIQTHSQLQYQEQQQQKPQSEYFETKQSGNANVGAQQNLQTLLEQPAPVYEKDLQSSPYRIYDDGTNLEGSQPIDRNYRTKYAYQPPYQNSQSDSNVHSDKIRVSASTEIPKAEIMKQIEKSVIRYMQELEAEGKIITAPKEPKTYYKLVTVPVESKRILTTTTKRPKYPSSEGTSSYEGSETSTTSSADPFPVEKSTRYQSPQSVYKHQDNSENIGSYQSAKHAQQSEAHDSLAPNIEFVYKIKSRAPLQTATVKTLSKPYTLPQKGAPKQFDHSAVLKSMEEFDLRHVVNTKDREEHVPSTSKPSILYFNSQVHQDINSLPNKGDKFRLTAIEYRKTKDPLSANDYNGYPGYFAEPSPIQTDQETQSENSHTEEGYQVMNPFQYKVRNEHPSSQFDDMPPNPHWDQPRINVYKKALFPVKSAEKPIDYDSLNDLKYNSHPDSYKHLQSHKPEHDRDSFHIVHKHVQRHALGHHVTTRGKRGGIHHSSFNKMVSNRNNQKETAANFALRPPPKV